MELKGLQLIDYLPSAPWLCQRAFLIAVNSGKPCGKATRLQLRVCGNGYKSIVMVSSRFFFLTVLARGQNPLLSNTTCTTFTNALVMENVTTMDTPAIVRVASAVDVRIRKGTAEQKSRVSCCK